MTTAPNDDTTAIKHALQRCEQGRAGASSETDVRNALRQRLQQEQRPGTALYITAQVLLLATLPW